MHDAVAFYNVNDNDNQANSNDDLAAETKNKNPEEEKRQRGESPEWRRRKKKTQRNTTATTTSTRIYATEWIEAKKKNQKKTKMCWGILVHHHCTTLFFDIFFLCSPVIWVNECVTMVGCVTMVRYRTARDYPKLSKSQRKRSNVRGENE